MAAGVVNVTGVGRLDSAGADRASVLVECPGGQWARKCRSLLPHRGGAEGSDNRRRSTPRAAPLAIASVPPVVSRR